MARLLEADPETRAGVMFGEPGTGHEEAAAALGRAGGFTKPLVALIVGDALECLPKGMSFGHTSSIIERGLGSPTRKKGTAARTRRPGRRELCRAARSGHPRSGPRRLSRRMIDHRKGE
jgi:succinyl-CoA synthetase alpha subunit